jgi:kynureninase
LSWRALIPKLKQGGKVPLNIHWCNLVTPRDGEARVSIITFDFEVGIKVLQGFEIGLDLGESCR